MQRSEVIRQIVARVRQGQTLGEALVAEEAAAFYAAACACFGTWETVLPYAGVRGRHLLADEELRPERVLERVRALSRGDYNLYAQSMRQRDWRLYEAAKRQFDNWRGALQATGVPRKKVPRRRKPRKLDGPQILKQLRQRQAAGLSMQRKLVYAENREPATAATHKFRSWRRALVATRNPGVGPAADPRGDPGSPGNGKAGEGHRGAR